LSDRWMLLEKQELRKRALTKINHSLLAATTLVD
jgi:hypothetical protein